MGFVAVISACVGCGRIFSYNPHKVPSIFVEGVREPVCRTCVELANPKRIANGLEAVIPDPEAYEPIDEEEL